jgi:ppGpp synthetase/RelA/SpoT-type nucleotidyltranferase
VSRIRTTSHGPLTKDELHLETAGIRAIVTSRAKSVTRLAEKCRERNKKRTYESVDEIYQTSWI